MISVSGPIEWLVLAGSLLFVIALPIATRAYWFGKHYERQMIIFLGNFLYNKEDFQRAHVRTGVPIMLVLGLPLFVLAAFMALLDEDVWSRSIPAGNLSGMALLSLVLFGVISAALYWSIMLYNRPKKLVPRDMRREPGILEERRRSRASKGSGT